MTNSKNDFKLKDFIQVLMSDIYKDYDISIKLIHINTSVETLANVIKLSNEKAKNKIVRCSSHFAGPYYYCYCQNLEMNISRLVLNTLSSVESCPNINSKIITSAINILNQTYNASMHNFSYHYGILDKNSVDKFFNRYTNLMRNIKFLNVEKSTLNIMYKNILNTKYIFADHQAQLRIFLRTYNNVESEMKQYAMKKVSDYWVQNVLGNKFTPYSRDMLSSILLNLYTIEQHLSYSRLYGKKTPAYISKYFKLLDDHFKWSNNYVDISHYKNLTSQSDFHFNILDEMYSEMINGSKTSRLNLLMLKGMLRYNGIPNKSEIQKFTKVYRQKFAQNDN